MAVEEGIDPSTIFEDDIFLIMKRLGVNYLTFDKVKDFMVFEFDESHIATALGTSPTPQPVLKRKKPWWQFW